VSAKGKPVSAEGGPIGVEAFFSRLAAHDSARLALAGRDRRVSYGSLLTEVARLTTMLREKPTLRIRMEYELHRGEELIATGSTLHAFIDRAGRPVRPPAAFAQVMARLFA